MHGPSFAISRGKRTRTCCALREQTIKKGDFRFEDKIKMMITNEKLICSSIISKMADVLVSEGEGPVRFGLCKTAYNSSHRENKLECERKNRREKKK
ncbi:hypothetical protein CEXT_105261 [Caerostris extrusa]|uniref:Uncharacterized protein n=1 Tax=Caerostris extrusa TaxID=172846 RepID=A0AAV4TFP1_CAEEX|nr:hypothetical protein CEXT_105261 [Caerostris extrusa]